MIGSAHKKIAVLINPDNPHLEGLLQGLRDFVREKATWYLHGINIPCYHHISNPIQWQGDGCLVFDHPANKEEKALLSNSPNRASVNKLNDEISSITCDPTDGLHLALEHLAGQGCRRVILHGIQNPDLIRSLQSLASELTLDLANPKEESIPSLIRSTTPPLGIIVPDCPHALRIQRLTQTHHLPSPLIVSLGDDQNCRLSDTGISSLAYPARELAFRATMLLAHQIEQPAHPHHLTFQETKLNIRGSSQHQQIDDLIIQKALAHIRLSITHSPLRVNELADFIGVSRTNLTERFQSELGLPPADVIRRERLTVAKRRLRRPNEMIKSVALSMGFSSSQEFARFFKNATGQTPSEFVASRKNGQNDPRLSKMHHF